MNTYTFKLTLLGTRIQRQLKYIDQELLNKDILS